MRGAGRRLFCRYDCLAGGSLLVLVPIESDKNAFHSCI